MTKNELIACLNDTERIATMSEDELVKYYIDLVYDYGETIGEDNFYRDIDGDSLHGLIQDYWPPEDVIDYLVSQLQSPVIETMDALREVAGVLQDKEFKTRWSYYATEWGFSHFVDVTKEELERLRQRILEFLAKEDKE